jgi:glycosyltransferase involved in cell wall biosynthesis
VPTDFDEFFLVIPNYDGEALFRRMLPSVDCPRNRILVVDIESKDGSRAFAKENGCEVIALSRPSSFCRALNVGIRWALEKGAKYIGLSNNDVTFATPVIAPLLETLRHERRLGIVAPTQVVASRKPPHKLASVIKYRSTWDLGTLQFDHDIRYPENQPILLEADFCEFTTVVIPAAVFADIGLLDEEFGFYYEDADFCFRAGLKGWRCAYLQTCQIIHYQGSTVAAERSFDKDHYIASNLRRFHQKHSVPGVSFEEVDNAEEFSSWPIASHFLLGALQKYGLIDKNGPKMVYNHPNDDDYDILFPLWETDDLPKHWRGLLVRYRHVLVASDFNRRVFQRYHPSVHKIGLGVEPDHMNPWGGAYRFSDRKTFLSVFRDQYRKAFDVTVKAWIESGLWRDNCELIAYSPNLDPQRYMSGPGETLRTADFISVLDRDHKVRFVKPNREFAFPELSKIYRAADFFVLNSRSEGFGLPVVEAMACGVPCIIPNYSSTEEFVTAEGCIAIDGKPVLADYSDKGFRDVGYWWEPDPAALSNAFKRAASLSESERTSMGEMGRQHVLSHFTWRHSAARFHEFCRQLPPVERSRPPIKRSISARRFWLRQFRRTALVFELLRHGQIGRVLVTLGRFLQRRGY